MNELDVCLSWIFLCQIVVCTGEEVSEHRSDWLIFCISGFLNPFYFSLILQIKAHWRLSRWTVEGIWSVDFLLVTKLPTLFLNGRRLFFQFPYSIRNYIISPNLIRANHNFGSILNLIPHANTISYLMQKEPKWWNNRSRKLSPRIFILPFKQSKWRKEWRFGDLLQRFATSVSPRRFVFWWMSC